jgi:adenine-specific DNA-methyltransferase
VIKRKASVDKLKMHSPNLTEDNIAKIGEIFPSCVVESKDDTGKLRLAIDFDHLRQELSDHLVEGEQERYRLNWPGKREALRIASTPIAKTLRPVRDESVNFDSTKNLFVEGDNLDALKLLQETYLGQLKLIYIDPPYNTGKDFVYDDNFAQSSGRYLEQSLQRDAVGNRLVANTAANGRFHSDWLSMMYSRLKLARNLLSADGSIFISIDDTEQASLKKICDEIFGESNFVANVIWQKKYAVSADDPGIAAMHDYLLVYRRTDQFQRGFLPRTEKQLKRYKNLDDHPLGAWSSDNYVSNKSKFERPTLYYPIVHPRTGSEVWPDESAVWRYNKEKHQQMVVENRLYWGPNQSYERPRLKRFLNEVQDGLVPSTWWPFDEVGHNDEGQKETAKIIGKKVFSTPKPIRLLERVLEVSAADNGLVMDFFAGSGSLAHAVMARNGRIGVNTRCISIQVPEAVPPSTPAYEAGFMTIAEISKERIRRSGELVMNDDCNERWRKDIGLRVLKIDSSNMQNVYYYPDEVRQGDLLSVVDNIKPDRSAEDLLFQVLVDWAVDLTLPISKSAVHGKDVFFVDGNALVACFEPNITEVLVKELAEHKPLRVVFRDNGFVSDALKINVEQIFRQISPTTEVKSI